MHTWSENPKKDVIQHLEILTYSVNCKKLLLGKIKSKRKINDINGKTLNRKATEMAFCIKQGIAYFKNADNADISISPLLLYYGILSFAKALIIANSKNDIFLDDIIYHGLTSQAKTESQIKQKQNKKNWKLINEFANTNDGVFIELSRLFNINFKKRSTFILKNTFACIPELKTIIDKLNILNSSVINCYQEIKEENNGISFSIHNYDKRKIEKIIPTIKKEFTCDDIHGKNLFLKYNSIQNIKLNNFKYLYNYTSVYGGRYFVPPVNYIDNNDMQQKVLLPQILIDYINFFILSEQVRYHQDNWNKVMNGSNNGMISILKIYIDCTKRRFTNEVLNELFNEPFTYGSPTFLS